MVGTRDDYNRLVVEFIDRLNELLGDKATTTKKQKIQ